MPVSSAAGAEQAIERAQRAFEIMRKLPRFVRADILSRAAELLKARRDEFVRTIAAEAGKPLYDARGEVSRAIFNLTNAAAEARRQSGEEIPLDADAGVFEYQTTGADGRPAALADLDHAALAAMRRRVGLARHFPIGPILAIAPFNFPLNLVMHKVAPAIAVGNSVVLKPAPQTPLTARLLQQLLAEAGLPEGALELGGNGAVIVAEDADLELAAARCVRDGSGIDTPADLAGKRIGVREYSNTAALVVRGVLTDEYDPGSCGWTAGDIDHLERDTIDPRNWPAHGVRIQAAPGRTLSSMIEAGELDALIAYTPPIAYGRGVRRLFPDWRKVEQGYYARTQRFPIMHIMALRRDVADAHPDLPEALLDAFTQAKQAAQDRLAIHQALPIMLPWMQAEAESTQAIMGRDFWPYGLEANRDMLETQIRWSHQQGLIERRPALDELFVA